MRLPKPAKPVRLLERELEQAAVDLLTADGWYAEKTELNYSERKKKAVGVRGMQDRRFTRPLTDTLNPFLIEQILVEFKREKGGKIGSRAEKLRIHQVAYHAHMRRLGFMTWIAGKDFPPTIDGFREFYCKSTLARSVRQQQHVGNDSTREPRRSFQEAR